MKIVLNTAPLTFEQSIKLRLLDHMLETMPGGSVVTMVEMLGLKVLREQVQDDTATGGKLDQGRSAAPH